LREIRWSIPAADLERICAHIERENPEAARRVAQTIFNGCQGLKRFPYLGRLSVRMAGRRELVFPPLPYIVVYRVTDKAVEIIHIFHGAQDWPSPRSVSCGASFPRPVGVNCRYNVFT
jgi:plasmid stabilization system protein ParE